MLIIVDGPEKAGKTTLINAFLKAVESLNYGQMNQSRSRHWGKIDPDDRVYGSKFIHDTTALYPVFWDRGWPSEHVYGKLLGRDRRLVGDPLLGEWLWGRGCVAKYIVLPENPKDLNARRTEEDLPVNPAKEYVEFGAYAHKFGYRILTNDYTEGALAYNVDHIMTDLRRVDTKGVIPQVFCGSHNSRVVFLTGQRDYDIPGGTLPFSNFEDYRIFKEVLGNKMIDFAWANKDLCPAYMLTDKTLIESK